MEKKNYQITIGYKSVITVAVKAESEEAAKKEGLNVFKKHRDGAMFKNKNIVLEDDYFKVDGVLNMDETWNMI